jgi:hypothetical protein
MRAINSTTTKAEIYKGADIATACHEAAELALKRNEIVQFDFNGSIYTATPVQIVKLVMDTKTERLPF